MTLDQSILTCFRKYATFQGTAARSEFWWWALFLFLASLAASIISERLGNLLALAFFVPTIAVTTRRLHDTDRSGWWQLIGFVPVVGTIVLIVWWAQASVQPNRFEWQMPAAA